MNARIKLLPIGLLFFVGLRFARAQSEAQNTRRLTLHEAVQMALKQNHAVRIADLKIQENNTRKMLPGAPIFPTCGMRPASLT